MSTAIYASIVSLAIGAGLGWAVHGANQPAEPDLSTASGSAASPILHSVFRTQDAAAPAAADTQQLRAMMREELSAALAADRGNRSAAPINTAPASPEMVAQRERALQDVESMISGSEWGNEQRQQFQQRIAMLDPEQAQRALHDVTVALNEGGIRVTTDGPPL